MPPTSGTTQTMPSSSTSGWVHHHAEPVCCACPGQLRRTGRACTLEANWDPPAVATPLSHTHAPITAERLQPPAKIPRLCRCWSLSQHRQAAATRRSANTNPPTQPPPLLARSLRTPTERWSLSGTAPRRPTSTSPQPSRGSTSCASLPRVSGVRGGGLGGAAAGAG